MTLSLLIALLGCTEPQPGVLADCIVGESNNGWEYETIETFDEMGFLVDRWQNWPLARSTWLNEYDGRPAIEEHDFEANSTIDLRTVWYYDGQRTERIETDHDLDGFRDEYIGFTYDSDGRLIEEGWYGVREEDLVSRTTFEWEGTDLVAKRQDGNADGTPEIEETWLYDSSGWLVRRERTRTSDGYTDAWIHAHEAGDNGGWTERVTEDWGNNGGNDYSTLSGYDRDGRMLWRENHDYEGNPYHREEWQYDSKGRLVRHETDYGPDGVMDGYIEWVHACDGEMLPDPVSEWE